MAARHGNARSCAAHQQFTGRDAALDLSLNLDQYLAWRRRFDDWLATAAIGLAAARRLGDRPGEGRALTTSASP
jgi:hypothetical protein